MQINVADIVRLAYDYSNIPLANKEYCNVGIILSLIGHADTTYYEVYWWPLNGVLWFPVEDLRLISKFK